VYRKILEFIHLKVNTYEMRTAKEVMTKKPICIGSGDELHGTIKAFVESGAHYVPVITPTGEVLGLMSEYSLVQAFLRHYLDPDRHDKVIQHKDILIPATFVAETDTLDEVIKALHTSVTKRLLVRNPRGLVVGIISPRDILDLLHGEHKGFRNIQVELKKSQKKADQLAAKISDLNMVITKYQKLYENSPYAMHSVNARGYVIMANKKLHQMLGYKPGELVGLLVTKLYADSVRPDVMKGLKEVIEKGAQHNIYSTMLTKEGEKLRVDVASSALYNDRGDFVSTITITRKVDSEILLRALHGVFDVDDKPKP
jgi:PAS domain S-box-containing protein